MARLAEGLDGLPDPLLHRGQHGGRVAPGGDPFGKPRRDPVGAAVARNAIGWYCALLGRYLEAEERCTRALRCSVDPRHAAIRAGALDSLGYVYARRGAHDAAIDAYRQAGAIYHDVDDRPAHALRLRGLGSSCLAAGRTSAAVEAWREAYRILASMSHPVAGDVASDLARVDIRYAAAANAELIKGP
jgi:tetratricopeptide (TPR) repeat protein